MSNKKIFIPSSGPDDWRSFLADPEKHWAKKYSARTLAHCWENASGFPPEILKVLKQSPSLQDIKPLLIFPEWKVPLPGGSTASQNDVWVLAKCQSGIVSITVEGKVVEPFGSTVKTWKAQTSEGKLVRLEYLADMLGLTQGIPEHIFYQLVHRTASAVIEAERFGATQAAMLVHSFSPANTGFNEFKDFAGLFNASAGIGKLVSVKARNYLPLHLAWVPGDERYLAH